MRTPIEILHGWEKLASDYSTVKKIFQDKGYLVFVPDLPGNPVEKLTRPVMTVNDYADWVRDYLKKHKINKAIFVCHSFGGRVAARLAVQEPLIFEKLILTGSPLVKEKLPLRKKIIAQFVKIAKGKLGLSIEEKRFKKLLYYLLREWDYYKAPEEIKETFKAIIKEDQSFDLPYITCPTLILWGSQDTFVPRSVGKKIAQLIPNAVYREIPGTHKLPYEKPSEFAKEVLEFIQQ